MEYRERNQANPRYRGKDKEIKYTIADKYRGFGSIAILRNMKCFCPLKLHVGQIDRNHMNTGRLENVWFLTILVGRKGTNKRSVENLGFSLLIEA